MDTADNTISGNANLTVSAPPRPAPHGQGSPPTSLPPSPTQTEPQLRRERSAQVVEWWLVSLHDGDYAWLTMPRQRQPAQDETYAWLAEVFSREGLSPSVWQLVGQP
jgi:hypothetical protein